MQDSSSTGQSINRVYRDFSRDFDFYGGHVWKVEYVPAYSHADRWFTSRDEAYAFADKQEGFRAPAGFRLITDQDDLSLDPMYEGPSHYSEETEVGVRTVWTAADGLVFEIESPQSGELRPAAARELRRMLTQLFIEVPS